MQKIALPRNLDATPIWNKDGLALIGLSIRVSGCLLKDERLPQFSRYAYLTEAFGYDVDRLVMVNSKAFKALKDLLTTEKYGQNHDYARTDKKRLIRITEEVNDIFQVFITEDDLNGKQDVPVLSKDVFRITSNTLYTKHFSPERDLEFSNGRIVSQSDKSTKLSTEDAKTLEWLVNNQIVPKSQEEFDILLERIKKQFYHPEVIHETIPLRAV